MKINESIIKKALRESIQELMEDYNEDLKSIFGDSFKSTDEYPPLTKELVDDYKRNRDSRPFDDRGRRYRVEESSINEDGIGGGATTAGVVDGQGNSDITQGTVYPFKTKPLKQAHNLGEPQSDFYGETTKRHNGKGGSISIPKNKK